MKCFIILQKILLPIFIYKLSCYLKPVMMQDFSSFRCARIMTRVNFLLFLEVAVWLKYEFVQNCRMWVDIHRIDVHQFMQWHLILRLCLELILCSWVNQLSNTSWRSSFTSFFDTFLESSFHGEGECKDVELFRTDDKPHEIASGVSLMQLELLIQEWEVLMTMFRHRR